jgi:hypothetical protein
MGAREFEDQDFVVLKIGRRYVELPSRAGRPMITTAEQIAEIVEALKSSLDVFAKKIP